VRYRHATCANLHAQVQVVAQAAGSTNRGRVVSGDMPSRQRAFAGEKPEGSRSGDGIEFRGKDLAKAYGGRCHERRRAADGRAPWS